MTDRPPVPDLSPAPPPGHLTAADPAPDGARDGRLRGFGSVAAVFGENKLAIIGLAVVLVVFAFCFLGPVFYHTDQVHTNLGQVTRPPGSGHPLGTDSVGYDELGRLMAGGQTSLTVGLSAAIIATFIGGLWGAVSGYIGGIVDSVMMRCVDVLLSIPTLFLLLFMASIFRPSRLMRGRRDPAAGRDELPGAWRPRAGHRLGRHAVGRRQLQLLRLLVADLPAGPGHRGDGRRVQLHRRCPA